MAGSAKAGVVAAGNANAAAGAAEDAAGKVRAPKAGALDAAAALAAGGASVVPGKENAAGVAAPLAAGVLAAPKLSPATQRASRDLRITSQPAQCSHVVDWLLCLPTSQLMQEMGGGECQTHASV